MGAFTLEKCKALAGGRYGVRENWESSQRKDYYFFSASRKKP